MNLTHLAINVIAATSVLTACGAVAIDTIDRTALVDGVTETRNLKFWMKERGVKGNALVPNVHFDDGANQRIVLWYDDALAARVDALVQGKVYRVSFTYAQGDALVYGTMTSVE